MDEIETEVIVMLGLAFEPETPLTLETTLAEMGIILWNY